MNEASLPKKASLPYVTPTQVDASRHTHCKCPRRPPLTAFRTFAIISMLVIFCFPLMFRGRSHRFYPACHGGHRAWPSASPMTPVVHDAFASSVLFGILELLAARGKEIRTRTTVTASDHVHKAPPLFPPATCLSPTPVSGWSRRPPWPHLRIPKPSSHIV